MTPDVLLDQLKLFVEAYTGGILLPVKSKPSEAAVERAAEVWKMRLPVPDDDTKRIPYILLQLVNGTDAQEEGEHDTSGCFVRMIFATYHENASEGNLMLLHLMMSVRTALLRQRLIGGQFVLEPPLEWVIYPDNDGRLDKYYFGEMDTNWRLPAIEREVDI
jgi:hypothetical protein